MYMYLYLLYMYVYSNKLVLQYIVRCKMLNDWSWSLPQKLNLRMFPPSKYTPYTVYVMLGI